MRLIGYQRHMGETITPRGKIRRALQDEYSIR